MQTAILLVVKTDSTKNITHTFQSFKVLSCLIHLMVKAKTSKVVTQIIIVIAIVVVVVVKAAAAATMIMMIRKMMLLLVTVSLAVISLHRCLLCHLFYAPMRIRPHQPRKKLHHAQIRHRWQLAANIKQLVLQIT